MEKSNKKLLIIGGRGALGQALVDHFVSKGVWVVSVDHGENEHADFNITLNVAVHKTSEQQVDWITNKLKEELRIDDGIEQSAQILDGIISVAGGWSGGNVLEKNFLKSVDAMWQQSVASSVVAAYLAGQFLKEGGLLVMTGAQAALNPTPTMIGYGMAKAAVHHLITSLASGQSGLPKNAVVVGLLPQTLDTPNNRKFATGQEDFGSWTPLDHVAGLIHGWLTSEDDLLKSGNLMVIVTKDGETSVDVH